ncbi:hypothetical protein COR50_05090 [Chitinophaga caeni]|uniref:Tail specific protease domain-containing protein n=1 Tax=Chitinophaga caeni TaxID=2029983 RepID=A0A291QRQ5_9BACT|nr:S41 family peptidase [Chitinophaga caeni]ATL46606.1 hypothetical protein COR50_05090 [Chitinophaga caeni]
MLNMRVFFSRALLASALASVMLFSCKKDKSSSGDPDPGPDPVDSVATLTPLQKSLDTMYHIFTDVYLWTNAVPDSATLKPLSFNSPEALFDKMITYQKDDQGNNLDHYSFLDDGTVSGEIGEGKIGDMGFFIKYYYRDLPSVNYCYPGSPAYIKGVRRGWLIAKINGREALDYDYAPYGNGDNVNFIVNALNGSSANFTFIRDYSNPNDTVSMTISSQEYSIKPVLSDTVYNFSGRKIGYFCFNSFINADLATPYLDPIFTKFSSEGVKQVVVDLRYNGGGAVTTAEYLSNMLAPASVTGANSVMYKETYGPKVNNKTMSAYSNSIKFQTNIGVITLPDLLYNWAFYNTTNYSKTNGLDLDNIIFIVTGSTASASELVINNLKPYFNDRLKLVGDTTYGKPVGFMALPVSGYDMYAVSVQNVNASNQGEYFHGFNPDITAFDDVRFNFADTREESIAKALIQLGVSQAELGRKANIERRTTRLMPTKIDRLGEHGFKGLLLNPNDLRKQ